MSALKSIQIGVQRRAEPKFDHIPSLLLQRKCACGGTLGPSGECEECRKKKPLRKAAHSELRTRNNEIAPATVHDVLRSPG